MNKKEPLIRFLLLLFTNDFSQFIIDVNVETTIYANDTTLVFKSNKYQELFTDIMPFTDKALQYCLQNHQALNPKRTTQIHFSRRQEQIPDISSEEHTILLGLAIDGKNLS